jgi:hypothetical protein
VKGLSLCCLTGGGSPARLGAILGLLRPGVDEIVVAVDARREDAARRLASVADRVVTFEHEPPGDRPIAWLFGLCSGDWILNVDDDEVPAPTLLDEVRDVVDRGDSTHGWIARRWLLPGATRYLDEPPWSTEFQLRLVLADERFLQFSDEFHRPVVAHGPARYVAAPLWHLDTALNPFEARRAKALAYERERRGMRIGALSHNSGLYLPELRGDSASAPVPEEDAARIAAVLAADEPPRSRRRIRAATRDEVDAAWPGEPFDPSLYSARLELVSVGPMTAELQQTVDVRVRNDGERTWRWGAQARPEIRLAYRWDGEPATGLRTPLPADLRPGEELVVPVHVVAPRRPGTRTLAVDLVHEHVRWFGVEATAAVEVRPRRRVALAGERAAVERLLDELLLVPEVEPVLLDADATAAPVADGHPRIPGLRTYLFGDDGRVRPALALRTARTLAAAARRRGMGGAAAGFVEGLAACDLLVVAGADWAPDAPQTRELWRLATTVAAAKAAGVPVLLTPPPPAQASVGAADAALHALLRRLARVAAPEADERDRRTM